MTGRHDESKGIVAWRVGATLLLATGAIFWATVFWGVIDHLDVRIQWVPTSEVTAARR